MTFTFCYRFGHLSALVRPALSLLFMACGLTACGGGGGAAIASPPGAPLVGAAVAGNTSASIAFTSPLTDGGAPVTAYAVACTASSVAVTATGLTSPLVVTGLNNGTAYSCSVSASNAAGTGVASATVSVTPTAPPPANTVVSTAGVLCDISGSEFNADESVRLTATYMWTCNGTARVLSSNGVPNHEVGTFPGPGNPNPIAAVNTSGTYTLSPLLRSSNTSVVTAGYAINGVKLEPATAGTCDNTGTQCSQAQGTGAWSLEALGQSVFNFGTDENNGHVQPTGAYHYHGMPERFITKLGKGTTTMTLVAWAPDGFPIYARYGYNIAGDVTSGVRVLRSSYQLKTIPDANRPAVALFPMGTFTQDYAYVTGTGDLDECNGRFGVTPEFPAGIHHYVVTDTFPFMGRCVRGTAASIR